MFTARTNEIRFPGGERKRQTSVCIAIPYKVSASASQTRAYGNMRVDDRGCSAKCPGNGSNTWSSVLTRLVIRTRPRCRHGVVVYYDTTRFEVDIRFNVAWCVWIKVADVHVSLPESWMAWSCWTNPRLESYHEHEPRAWPPVVVRCWWTVYLA